MKENWPDPASWCHFSCKNNNETVHLFNEIVRYWIEQKSDIAGSTNYEKKKPRVSTGEHLAFITCRVLQ